MTLDERLWKTFNRALGQYQLIDEDDRILVGLSGGKDSLCLLEMLARRSKIRVPRFSVEALHVRMENIHYETDTTYLQRFCDRLGVTLHIITTSFATNVPDGSVTAPDGSSTVPDDSVTAPDGSSTVPDGLVTAPDGSSTVPADSPSGKGKRKPACFLCSWQRRKQLFNLAQELGCTKIALGHHQDDIIHTALMNLTFQGRFDSMPAKLRMRKMPLMIIRPLCLCREDDIRAYAEEQGYEKQLKQCPYESTTHRTTAAALFDHMQRLNPEARYCIWRALESDKKL